jgi:hypothetical protein
MAISRESLSSLTDRYGLRVEIVKYQSPGPFCVVIQDLGQDLVLAEMLDRSAAFYIANEVVQKKLDEWTSSNGDANARMHR